MRIRDDFFDCLTARGDELFDFTDVLLCADGPVRAPVDLTLVAEHRRGHGAMCDTLNSGNIDVPRLRQVLAGLPMPQAGDGRLVPAVDVSNWLRPDAPTSADRLFCHVYGRSGRPPDRFVPGRPYSIVAALESGRTSWCQLLVRGTRDRGRPVSPGWTPAGRRHGESVQGLRGRTQFFHQLPPHDIALSVQIRGGGVQIHEAAGHRPARHWLLSRQTRSKARRSSKVSRLADDSTAVRAMNWPCSYVPTSSSTPGRGR
ncbi:transposase [Streptomyces ipomoeae]|jgi:hypothetical protein|uniref:transposase n=1 Tax=Streptomyces ipomoeae TaxID=103232 RepID=UPI0035A6D4E0